MTQAATSKFVKLHNNKALLLTSKKGLPASINVLYAVLGIQGSALKEILSLGLVTTNTSMNDVKELKLRLIDQKKERERCGGWGD